MSEAAVRLELALLLLEATALPSNMGMCFADHTRNSRAALAQTSRLAPLPSSLKPSSTASRSTMVSADSLQVIREFYHFIRTARRCIREESKETRKYQDSREDGDEGKKEGR